MSKPLLKEKNCNIRKTAAFINICSYMEYSKIVHTENTESGKAVNMLFRVLLVL